MRPGFSVSSAAQRSPEWYAERVGRLTASRAADMLATIKTGEAAARRDLRVQLVCERLTGQSHDDTFVSKEMQRGSDLEPAAFAAYEAETGLIARTVGFCAHETLLTGGSPDGVIGDFNGLLELKCPKAATHLKYLRSGKVPAEHLPQIQHNLWITGATWADFVSFDDRFPLPLRLVRYRVLASDIDFKSYELLVRMFLSEVDREVDDLMARMAA